MEGVVQHSEDTVYVEEHEPDNMGNCIITMTMDMEPDRNTVILTHQLMVDILRYVPSFGLVVINHCLFRYAPSLHNLFKI